MTAGHGGMRGPEGTEDAQDALGDGRAGEYGGMDALMAAITGEALPREARRDPGFLAAHRAAEADVAVLRGQLAWLAEALTGDVSGEETRQEAGAGVCGEPARPPRPAQPARPPRPAQVSRSARRPRAAVRPPGPGRRPPRPGRPSGRRRTLRFALGSLAGGAAFALVAGFGWMVTHGSGGAGGEAGTSSAAKSVRTPATDAGPPADPALELACSRLVVEGTVTRVEPGGSSPWSRVTLTVLHSYKPAHGPGEVGFLLGGGARPAPRTGQHVLVTVGAGNEKASLWAVGDARVAVGRAWITEALAASRHTTCGGR